MSEDETKPAPLETEPGKQMDDNIDDLGRKSGGTKQEQPGKNLSSNEARPMHNGERVFYTSENGDRWLLLADEEEIVTVRHVPNAASGGNEKTYELGGFLIDERHAPQNQALRALISSLTRSE
jgi:hypothetical protein